jgi:hypothetical protein
MSLLGAAYYDPAVAVTKATSALLAMTAFDTANLRLTVTVPAHGRLMWRIRCAYGGGTAQAGILLGVLQGATVKARLTPAGPYKSTLVAADNVTLEAVGIMTGLTPGSTAFDAAYGVELVVAGSSIRYGGPNNTTTSDAYGAIGFELWDVG